MVLRGRAALVPVLQSIATFQTTQAGPHDPPDAMFWVSDPRAAAPAFTIDTVLLKPRSRGSVRLRSTDPGDPPRIELPGLRAPGDLDRLTEAYALGLEIADRPEMAGVRGGPAPAVSVPPEELATVVRSEAYSDPHVVGTCAMGVLPAEGAVVDASGTVHGVIGLSVVDASIIPEPPSGFPHLITIMIAERLSERIAGLV